MVLAEGLSKVRLGWVVLIEWPMNFHYHYVPVAISDLIFFFKKVLVLEDFFFP